MDIYKIYINKTIVIYTYTYIKYKIIIDEIIHLQINKMKTKMNTKMNTKRKLKNYLNKRYCKFLFPPF
jgi:hypothetical protein